LPIIHHEKIALKYLILCYYYYSIIIVDAWFSDWLKEPLLPTSEARARILQHLSGLGLGIDIEKAGKLLFT
jgi:hypothetical protein